MQITGKNLEVLRNALSRALTGIAEDKRVVAQEYWKELHDERTELLRLRARVQSAIERETP